MTHVRTRVQGATLAAVLLIAAIAAGTAAQATRPIVILVSIDGWRHDYLERFAPPTIAKLAAAGVRSEGLIPIFPSKTFPNHYSIVTGLYPARHGIVSNTMIDPFLPGRFSLSDREVQQDTRWWGGEPLWITAEQQGQLAGTMFWPGSDVEIDGRRPRYWQMFDDDLPNDARVDQVLGWLKQPEPQRPRFLTLYFSDIDGAGHRFGPDAAETRAAAQVVDRSIARLVDGVRALQLESRVNYVLVSDHGMAALSPSRAILLDDYIDSSRVEVIDSSPVVTLNPVDLTADELFAALKDKHPNLKVFTRDTLPEEYRLRGHPRLAAVIGIADDGWHVLTKSMQSRWRSDPAGGNHGYDPRHRSMHGLFVASGPQFKTGIVAPPFENVHVYELICKVLGLRPGSNDGDARVTESFLRP